MTHLREETAGNRRQSSLCLSPSAAEVTPDLGIGVGDFIAFDPRVEVTPSGFVRSRHLEDKAGVVGRSPRSGRVRMPPTTASTVGH
jgi:hypothetical protein